MCDTVLHDAGWSVGKRSRSPRMLTGDWDRNWANRGRDSDEVVDEFSMGRLPLLSVDTEGDEVDGASKGSKVSGLRSEFAVVTTLACRRACS